MSEKNGADLLKECLEQINEDIRKADNNLCYGFKDEARRNLATAQGRVENFLTIMGFL